VVAGAAGVRRWPAYAALARVADPAGLPPAYIEFAQLDMFRDKDLADALRLGQAGVPVEFHLHPGAPHEFDFIAFNVTVARRAIADRVTPEIGQSVRTEQADLDAYRLAAVARYGTGMARRTG